MKTKHKLIAKCVLIFSGIMLGMECQGLVILPKVRTQIGDIEQAVQVYAMHHNGKLPASLDNLIQGTENSPPLLNKEDLIDPWGEPFLYEREGRQYVIMSSGPDRIMGTKDDFYDGSLTLFEKIWNAKHEQAIEEQKTNAVQEATTKTTQSATGIGKTQANCVPVTGGQSPTESAETKSAPWKIPLLIGVFIFGSVTAWCYFKKRKRA